MAQGLSASANCYRIGVTPLTMVTLPIASRTVALIVWKMHDHTEEVVQAIEKTEKVRDLDRYLYEEPICLRARFNGGAGLTLLTHPEDFLGVARYLNTKGVPVEDDFAAEGESSLEMNSLDSSFIVAALSFSDIINDVCDAHGIDLEVLGELDVTVSGETFVD